MCNAPQESHEKTRVFDKASSARTSLRQGKLEVSDASVPRPLGDSVSVRTDFQVGEHAQISKTIDEIDILSFAEITGDFNPVHTDLCFAQKTRFKGRIAHGMLSAGLISAALGTRLPGPGGIYLSQTLKFVRPVRVGDTLTAEVEVTDWDSIKRIMTLETRCFNQNHECVTTGNAVLLVEPIQRVE